MTNKAEYCSKAKTHPDILMLKRFKKYRLKKILKKMKKGSFSKVIMREKKSILKKTTCEQILSLSTLYHS